MSTKDTAALAKITNDIVASTGEEQLELVQSLAALDAPSHVTRCNLLLEVKSLLAQYTAFFQPNIDKWDNQIKTAKEGKAAAISERDNLLAKLTAAKSLLDRQIGAYVIQESERAEERRKAEIAKSLDDQRKAKEAEAVRLVVEDGDTIAAETLLAEVEDGTIAATVGISFDGPAMTYIPKVAGVSVRVPWDYSIVNPDLVKAKYTLTVPDKDKIKRTVKEYGKLAEEMVGGIAVFRKPSTASKRY